jgi:hypothetical protein
LEFQFAKEVAAVERQAEASLRPVSEKDGLGELREKLLKLSMASPEAAIADRDRSRLTIAPS